MRDVLAPPPAWHAVVGFRRDEPARVVMFSTASDPEVVVYPDEGKIGVFADWSREDRPELRGWVAPA